jgi:hypothetical protein
MYGFLAMTSFFNNNFSIPKRPYAVFISNKGSSSSSFADGDKPNNNNIPSCRPCGNRRMEPLESEGVYICCGCGKRVPISISMFQSQPTTTTTTTTSTTTSTSTTTTKQEGGGGAAAGIKVIGSPSTTGGREKKKIAFAQPKNQSARDWFKRKHDPKNSGKYDADDIALMNSRSGVTITHTFEIKRRPDTLPNPTDYGNGIGDGNRK